ncbi:uncharacterized protein DS421_9g265960 [Arachis hypogaea]|nr:uncharacterized protein DS421_9g265960 [Arachis hypogaea]
MLEEWVRAPLEAFWKIFQKSSQARLGSAGGCRASWSCISLVHCRFTFNVDQMTRTGPVFTGSHRV